MSLVIGGMGTIRAKEYLIHDVHRPKIEMHGIRVVRRDAAALPYSVDSSQLIHSNSLRRVLAS
jgi:hypothetical protein